MLKYGILAPMPALIWKFRKEAGKSLQENKEIKIQN